MTINSTNPKVYLFIGVCNVKCIKRKKQIISNILIRKLSKFGNITPDDIFLDYNGKKQLPKYFGMQYSVSYSGSFFCIALASENIGVDIERKRKLDIKHLLTCFHITEQVFTKTSDVPWLSFLYFWTIKESISKYIGLGLKMDFAQSIISDQTQNIFDNKWLRSGVFNCFIRTIELNQFIISICLQKESNIVISKIDTDYISQTFLE